MRLHRRPHGTAPDPEFAETWTWSATTAVAPTSGKCGLDPSPRRSLIRATSSGSRTTSEPAFGRKLVDPPPENCATRRSCHATQCGPAGGQVVPWYGVGERQFVGGACYPTSWGASGYNRDSLRQGVRCLDVDGRGAQPGSVTARRAWSHSSPEACEGLVADLGLAVVWSKRARGYRRHRTTRELEPIRAERATSRVADRRTCPGNAGVGRPDREH